MTHSEPIADLAAALAKAQSQMETAKKDSSNPYFKSTYADLASVWDACRGPLTSNGLSIVQAPSCDTTASGETLVGVTTVLLHESGQFVESYLTMKPVKDDPQGIGSCITYARRYALAAVVGIAPADDDGNAASGKHDKPVTTEAITLRRPMLPAQQEVSPKPRKNTEKAAAPPENGEILQAIVDTVKPEEPVAEGFISREKQVWLLTKFREALPEKYRASAISDSFRQGFLETLGFVDAEGKGSSKMIPEDKFTEVARRAIQFAREQS